MKNHLTEEDIELLSIIDSADFDLSQGYLSTDFSPELIDYYGPYSKKRNRKNREQVQLLISEFEDNPLWSKEVIRILAQKTGLSEAQIYKWNWDYKKKNKGIFSESFEGRLLCKESMRLLRFDEDMRLCQLAYKMQFSNITSFSPTGYLV